MVSPELTDPSREIGMVSPELTTISGDRYGVPGTHDTLAKVYFDFGDATKALKTQERAIRLMKEYGQRITHAVEDRLEQYEKAVEEK
jgi:hypothetical protein